MAKPRPVSQRQLWNLNRSGSLQIVPPGTGKPLTYQQAWDALAEALEAGLWTPSRKPTKGERA